MFGGKEVKRIQVDTDKLQMGMYVSALDRPWTESPFLMQGFAITSPKVLEKLRELCVFVYIDSTKSLGESAAKLKLEAADSNNAFSPTHQANNPFRASTKKLPIKADRYEFRPIIRGADMSQARKSFSTVSQSVGSLFTQVKQDTSVDAARFSEASQTLVGSAIRQPSALSWLAMMQKHNDQIYNHALRASTWALLCGRHMGLPETDLKHLSLGILLKDIGHLAKKNQGAVKGESREAQSINRTLRVVKQSTQNRQVLDIISNYREKFNGTGKPQGLQGEAIPLLARITSIATAYDLLLYPINSSRSALSPSEAASYLYSQRGRAFQDELVVQFIEALGTYPVGTILQLDSGEIGVVVDHDPQRRLKPTLMVIADEFGQPTAARRLINLANPKAETESVSKVLRDLSTRSLNVDMSDVQNQYQALLGQTEKRGLLARLLRRRPKD